MKSGPFVALDVHCAFSAMCVVTRRGRVIDRRRVPMTIPELVAVIEDVKRPRKLTFEEGTLADWLTRNLTEHVDELVDCEPRWNHWIGQDSDKGITA